MIIAGTGHRPTYMPGKYDETHPWQVDLKLRIGQELMKHNVELVIAGGALGFDMFLAEMAHQLRIPFDLYLPFKDTGNNWPEKSQERLEILKQNARRVVFYSWNYSPRCFHIRDYAMVDDADVIYSLLSPEAIKGGTFDTVKYAKKKSKLIKNFWK